MGARNDRTRWRARSNCRSRRCLRRMNDRRCLTWLGHDLSRLGPCRNRRCRYDTRWRRGSWSETSGGRRNSSDASGSLCARSACHSRTRTGSRSRTRTGRTHNDRRSTARPLRKLCLPLGFLLARKYGLHHIARLGDVGEVNFGAILLLASRACRRCRPGSAFKMPTNLLGFIRFNGTRVGFALGQTHKFQSVENLFTLDFQLTRQIVNSNLTHPPLFVVLPNVG